MATIIGTAGSESLLGGEEPDVILGLEGDDYLVRAIGNDTLSGGAGNDRFEFAARFGIDRITDFEGGAGAGDILRFIGLGVAFDSFAEIMAVTAQSGANAIINFGGGKTITLLGFNKANLNADDFVFG
jgi:Ca2+-binding RTX toxin-like protein